MATPSSTRTSSLAALGAVITAAAASACPQSQPLRQERAGAPATVGSTTLAVATVAPRAATKAPPLDKDALPDESASACPSGMILVEGEFCPDVEQRCLEWMDPPNSRYHRFRCARYAPSVCKSEARVPMRYCIDATERVEHGDRLPQNFMSWTSSRELCASEGARLCREREWVFACEGEAMLPYPYGFERDATACNVDRTKDLGRPGRLVDHRSVVASHERCKSPFGVQDMAGNLEEWVQADGRGKMGWKEVLKGSWWIPSRHACRQFQIGHDDVYKGAETGTRCCKDAAPRAPGDASR